MTMNAAHTDNLSEPIKISLRHPTIASGPTAAAEANAREWMRAYEESVAKLERVLQSYGLRRTGNDDLTLSLRLAIDLHPGFKVVDINAPKPYQHRRGNPVTLMMLIADVETVKREKLPRACSDSEAVRILASSQRFASRWGDFRRRVRTLKNWLSEAHDPAMNPMLPIWRLAEAGRQLPAMIEVFGSVRGRHHEN
jgi:hypothetical protein